MAKRKPPPPRWTQPPPDSDGEQLWFLNEYLPWSGGAEEYIRETLEKGAVDDATATLMLTMVMRGPSQGRRPATLQRDLEAFPIALLVETLVGKGTKQEAAVEAAMKVHGCKRRHVFDAMAALRRCRSDV